MKIYLCIFVLVIIYLAVFENFDFQNIQNYEKILGANYNYTEDGIQIERHLEIGDLHYNIIYEEASNRYLVFINYNVFIGYIDLSNEEDISIIDENNFYKYLIVENLKKE